MTINKVQGQNLGVARIDLITQYYVALSRVTSKQNMLVFTRNQAQVINVTYKEIF